MDRSFHFRLLRLKNFKITQLLILTISTSASPTAYLVLIPALSNLSLGKAISRLLVFQFAKNLLRSSVADIFSSKIISRDANEFHLRQRFAVLVPFAAL